MVQTFKAIDQQGNIRQMKAKPAPLFHKKLMLPILEHGGHAAFQLACNMIEMEEFFEQRFGQTNPDNRGAQIEFPRQRVEGPVEN